MQFGKIVKILKEMVDTVTFEVTADKFSAITLDVAHVFLIELVLYTRTAFTDYNVRTNGIVTVKAASLNRAFKNVKENDIVSLNARDDKLKITIQKTEPVTRTISFNISQMVIEQDNVVIPDREYMCRVLMPTSVLFQICEEIKSFGDMLQIKVDRSHIKFLANNEMEEVKITISNKRPIPGFGILCTSAFEQVFKAGYFVKMGKVGTMTQSSECLLQVGPESPLSLHFQLNGAGTIEFFLAPLMDEEEE